MSVQGARLLSLVLGGACALLLLLAIAMQIGLGRGYHWSAPDQDAAAPITDTAIDRQPFKLPPESAFVETVQRPLFNEDRQPTPDMPPAEVKQPEPAVPLNVALTGVILTPQVHIALLHDNGKNAPMSVKEGAPLAGDLGGWTLTRVKPRSAIFKDSASGDEVEVELSTAVASQKPGSPPHPGGATPAPTAAAPVAAPVFGPKPPASPGGKPAETAQAEQMQRRIEERRRQMREEAERLKQQANPPPQPPQQH